MKRAWIGDKGTVVPSPELVLADYPEETFSVGCADCRKSLPKCVCGGMDAAIEAMQELWASEIDYLPNEEDKLDYPHPRHFKQLLEAALPHLQSFTAGLKYFALQLEGSERERIDAQCRIDKALEAAKKSLTNAQGWADKPDLSEWEQGYSRGEGDLARRLIGILAGETE